MLNANGLSLDLALYSRLMSFIPLRKEQPLPVLGHLYLCISLRLKP